jgi:hypothetical protein
MYLLALKRQKQFTQKLKEQPMKIYNATIAKKNAGIEANNGQFTVAFKSDVVGVYDTISAAVGALKNTVLSAHPKAKWSVSLDLTASFVPHFSVVRRSALRTSARNRRSPYTFART